MRFDFQPTYFLMALANAAVLGGAVTWFSQLSFWITWPLVIAAMFINGSFANGKTIGEAVSTTRDW